MNGFLPPVIFQVQANATQAIASFQKVNAQLSAMEAQALKTGVAVSKMNKALSVGTFILKGFALAFVAVAAIGVKSLMDIEKSYSRLGQAMANQGLATKENLAATSELVDSYESLGFGSEKAADAMSVLVTATGNLEKSNHLLSVAADLARSRQVSLADAASMLVKAQGGAAKLFTQYGIALDSTKPKAEATAEAMAKLEAKLKGQAETYAKTTAGQLAIMKEGFGDIAEAVGGKVLPVFNKFISGIKAVGSFLAKHQEVLFGVATVIAGVLIPTVVLLTKKLYANAVAWAVANAPILAIVAAVAALGAAFVWAWNKFDWFRKGVVEGLKIMLKWWGFLLRAIGVVAEGFVKVITGPLKTLLKGLGFFNDDAKKMAANLEKMPAAVGDFFDKAAAKVEGFAGTVDKWKDKKIHLDFKVPQIKAGENGVGGIDDTTDAVKELADALIKAKQDAADFREEMIKSAVEIRDVWTALVKRDTKDAIRFGLLDPVDQLIEKTSTLMTSYKTASSKFAGANNQLAQAQRNYEAALKGTDKALIASTESALKRAKDIVNDTMGTIKTSLEDLKALQDDIIAEIVSLYQKIDELKKEKAKVLAESLKEEQKLLKEHNKTIEELNKAHNNKVIDAQKAAAQRTAEIIKTSVDQLRGIYRNATQKNIGEIFAGLTFQGNYLKGGTVEKLIGALGMQTGKAKTLADDAAKLSGLGFSQTFIEQVVAQGPDVGHELAQTIIKSSPESVKSLQQYWNDLEKQSQHGVDAIAQQMNSGLTLATEELTAQLAQVGKDLADQLATFTKELTDETAIQVQAYKDRLKEIQDATAATVAAIDADINKYQGQIGSLEKALETIQTTPAPSTNDIIPFTPSETQPVPPVTNQPFVPEVVTPAAPKATTPTTTVTKYTVKPGDTLSAIAKANDISLKKLLADNPKFTEVEKYQGGNMIWAGTTVNIKATTNATSESIASDVGWAVRTSSDISYGSLRQRLGGEI
jgi:LysM repeat protein/uncharacterized membrane protein (Fun14 family)